MKKYRWRYIYHFYGRNWKKQRQLVLKRDNYRCRQCGTTTNLHIHHIVKRKKFGNNELLANYHGNLITLCRACHRSYENERKS
jgi:5-methylcytosine-specific restriction endonuclease McrA